MTVTKSTLFEAVCHTPNLKKPEAAAAIEGVLDISKSALAGDDLMLDGRRVIRFRSSPALRRKMNGSK
jgi:nucleoid DNA-binding protein